MDPLPQLARSDGSAAFVHEVVDGQDFIYVLGEIDIATSSEFANDIWSRSDSDGLTVDLTNCTYLDSSCLNVLIRAKRLLQDRLQVIVPREARIRRIFEITGLESHLDIITSQLA